MSYFVRWTRFALALFPLSIGCGFLLCARVIGGKDMHDVLRDAVRGGADV